VESVKAHGAGLKGVKRNFVKSHNLVNRFTSFVSVCFFDHIFMLERDHNVGLARTKRELRIQRDGNSVYRGIADQDLSVYGNHPQTHKPTFPQSISWSFIYA
jgi:hypothetical protein